MGHKPTLYSSKIVNTTFGKDVKIVEPVNIYGCSVSDKTFIGPFVEIQKDVTIGEGTKIQSHSFICELVDIGNYCFIGHGVMLQMIFSRMVHLTVVIEILNGNRRR